MKIAIVQLVIQGKDGGKTMLPHSVYTDEGVAKSEAQKLAISLTETLQNSIVTKEGEIQGSVLAMLQSLGIGLGITVATTEAKESNLVIPQSRIIM